MEMITAEQLKQLMWKHYESAYSLANALGVQQGTVRGWLRGRRPQARNLRALKRHYQLLGEPGMETE